MTSSASRPSFDFLRSLHRQSEEELVSHLMTQLDSEFLFDPAAKEQHFIAIRQKAKELVEGVRRRKIGSLSIENFLQTYDLGSREGIALLCLAEAYLRIPDETNQTALIKDKIGSVDWSTNYCRTDSFLVKLATLGLSTTESLLTSQESSGVKGTLSALSRKLTTPLIRQTIHKAMKLMGHQFVLGESIEEALKKAYRAEKKGYLHSYDMLGEGAKTAADADRYTAAYQHALQMMGTSQNFHGTPVEQNPSLSVKLTALHPRYEISQKDRVFDDLYPRLYALCFQAKKINIGLTIDAEESERLEISLEILAKLCEEKELKDWNGLGLAVQAYQKRAAAVIDWVNELSVLHQRRFCVRLVKGAYWDTEIKRAQETGVSDYPVFTRKHHTDLNYLYCAKKMFLNPTGIYAQFATHNAYTVASILELANSLNTLSSPATPFEFQRLHGMGEALFEQVLAKSNPKIPCRIYAPVGQHHDLLAYLVRRLLENGANSSFVNKIYDPKVPAESLIENPLEKVQHSRLLGHPHHHPKIPYPCDILLPERSLAKGIDLSDQSVLYNIQEALQAFKKNLPLHLSAASDSKEVVPLYDPADPSHLVSLSHFQTREDLQEALHKAETAFEAWSLRPVDERAQCLEKWADLLEQNIYTLMGYLVYEGGKVYADAVSEIREAIDFCRYYAVQARRLQTSPQDLRGPTGEINELSLHGRGIFACISPWNFPLAIFTGQVAAALVSGNCVLAKPAQQVPAIATYAVQLAHEAGIPTDVLQLILAKGTLFSDTLLSDNRIAGVAFTGSTEVARTIGVTLAQRTGPIAPFIAETGGINAMIVDSSALPEQAVRDILISAFQSAGQRCSALRLLYVQEEIANTVFTMLKGAMKELRLGHSSHFSTDIGPVIDQKAHQELRDYEKTIAGKAHLLSEGCVKENLHAKSNFISPQAWILNSAEDLSEEIFGPILHIVPYKKGELPQVIEQINKKGYGLTLGIHSRIDETIAYVRKHARVGNMYVNRSIIGAVVGIQPFGGEGLSGTGPKAGGPHYLLRFMGERTYTRDTTAAGGNASLLATAL